MCPQGHIAWQPDGTIVAGKLQGNEWLEVFGQECKSERDRKINELLFYIVEKYRRDDEVRVKKHGQIEHEAVRSLQYSIRYCTANFSLASWIRNAFILTVIQAKRSLEKTLQTPVRVGEDVLKLPVLVIQ